MTAIPPARSDAQATVGTFGGVATTLPRLPWDIAFQIERNEWNGSVTPQIHIRAVRSAEAG